MPFVALPAALAAHPSWSDLAALVGALYAGLIVSFLGGARYGLAIPLVRPGAITLALSNLPTLLAFLLFVGLHDAPRRLLTAFAFGLVALWGWDALAVKSPPWYPRFRAVLTFPAAASLLLAAALFRG